jgi:hypothetical protein
VLRRYERVCFTRESVRPLDKPGAPFAAMLHPGHPLMLAVSDLLLEQHGNLLRQGAILIDPADEGEEPHLLFLLTPRTFGLRPGISFSDREFRTAVSRRHRLPSVPGVGYFGRVNIPPPAL